jgi:glycosyltransferase involved in cell wall biosynthesis
METRKSKQWYFLADKMTLSLCDVQTAVSESARNFHAEHLCINPDIMPVIHNGIVTPKKLSATDINKLLIEWGVDNCSAVIGSIGRLGHEKGYDMVIEALPQIAALVPAGQTWGVVIIGEGAERDKLERMAKNAPPTIKVCLPGFRRDAAECIGAFDLFLMPSRYEGFGLALIEAMSHGLPIIASKIGPLHELLKNYSNGCFWDFSANPTTALAEKIFYTIEQKSLPSPDLSFTSDKMVENYLELYNSQLKLL